jgi:ankyrin repeat protein
MSRQNIFTYCMTGNLNGFRQLILNGVNPNYPDDDNHTPLHWATEWNQIEMVKELLNHKVSINVQDCVGETPLYMAVRQNYLEIVKLLLQNGADVNIKTNNGETPFHFAVKCGMVAMIKELIPYVDLSVKNRDGLTALDLVSTDEIRELINQDIIKEPEQ